MIMRVLYDGDGRRNAIKKLNKYCQYYIPPQLVVYKQGQP